jgi:exodeoxyribonuclease VII large subunit
MPSIYKAKGRFSFRVETLEIAGEGSLKKAYEALKKKLAQEGLFDRKRALPGFIQRVGLVTSKTGAVIDDFRRNLLPLGIRVVHADVRVEGSQAADQIIRAMTRLNLVDVDVVVVIRGGGSMEDLAAFNNEHVVRAVFGSRVPTIVAIGHDRDVPLAQMVADGSASTPTATAHLINASWERLRAVDQTGQQLVRVFENALASVQSSLGQQLVHAVNAVGNAIERIQQTIDAAERHLAAASPDRLLKLGYSIITDPTGAVERSVGQLRHGQEITTRLAKGSFTAEVKELQSEHA